MAEANDTFGRLYQNLIDAGCSAETVAQCMELAKRRILRKTGRAGQKRIDCLDYLIYQIQNDKMQEVFT